MTFFEPRPPQQEPERAPWRPPLWDRPSEGTLGAILPVSEVVARNDSVVVAIDHLRVYPNGFGIDVLILRNPDEVQAVHPAVLHQPRNWPRVGVRFADGRTAGRENLAPSPYDVPKDAAGIPTVPIVRHIGGGGGGAEYHMRTWVFPLPPDGPMDIYVQVGDLPEATSQSTVWTCVRRLGGRRSSGSERL